MLSVSLTQKVSPFQITRYGDDVVVTDTGAEFDGDGDYITIEDFNCASPRASFSPAFAFVVALPASFSPAFVVALPALTADTFLCR